MSEICLDAPGYHDTLIQYVKDNSPPGRVGKYRIVYRDGRSETARLFVSTAGILGYLPKGKRSKGYPFSCLGISRIAVVPVKSELPREELFNRNIERLRKILDQSGLWSDLLSLPNAEFNYENYDKYYPDLADSIVRWRVKKMNFRSRHGYDDTEFVFERIRDAIKNDKDYQYVVDGVTYDVRVSYNAIKKCGWYSEEYRGCGNGHYYLMIDSEHVLFSEDD